MPFKTCPECGKQVREIDPHCWKCEYVFPEFRKIVEKRKADQRRSDNIATIGCAIVAVAVLIGGFQLVRGCASTPASEPEASDSAPDPFLIAVLAEDQLKASLKDPESAQFRERFVSRVGEGPGMALCGEVNSRNSFGGYTGFRRFIAGPAPGQPTAIEGENVDRRNFQEVWRQVCANPIQSIR